MDIMEIQKILPHRYPLLLIDRIISYEKGKSIKGYKNITITEEIFQGHFPGHPVYPGVMVLEGMAQLGGFLALKTFKDNGRDITDKVIYFAAIDDCKFRKPVKPGDKILYELIALKTRDLMWVMYGKAYVDDVLVSEAKLKAVIVDKNNA